MKENISKIKNPAKVNIYGQKVAHSKDSLKAT